MIIIINIILSKALLDSMGHVGLALSLSVSTGIEAFILVFILRRRIGGFGTEFGVWLAKIILATAIMALVSALVATKGLATFIISSELSELMAICDRILVMREGKISGEVRAETATQEQILQLALPDSSITNA